MNRKSASPIALTVREEANRLLLQPSHKASLEILVYEGINPQLDSAILAHHYMSADVSR